MENVLIVLFQKLVFYDFYTTNMIYITLNIIICYIVSVTQLPCITLPYIKNVAVCLQMHGFNKTSEYVKVLFDLKAKLSYTSLNVPLGCLLIPRLHPHTDMNKTVCIFCILILIVHKFNSYLLVFE